MANYSELLNDINAAIYENNDQEIDALEVRAILREMVTSLGSGFLFKGIATPSSPSGTGTYEPDQNVFYLATTAGTYTYLGGLVVAAGEVAFLCFDGTWTKKSSALLSTGSIVDNTTTEDATKPLSAKQGKVLSEAGAATAAEVSALGQKLGYDQFDTDYIRAYIDQDGRFLWGIKTDGSIEWSVGIPGPVRDALAAKVDAVVGKALIDAGFANAQASENNPEYLSVIVDSIGKILAGREIDGTLVENVGIKTKIVSIIGNSDSPDVPKIKIGEAVLSNEKDGEGRLELLLDSEGKVISERREDGTKVEKVGLAAKKLSMPDVGLSELARDFRNIGLISNDWTDSPELHIPMPNFAVVNISGIETMPQTKTTDAKAVLQFWDMNGNYFKKEVIANAQGNSSLAHPKKNIAIDICNNNGWDDDDTFSLQIGDWVAQDSFHLKAYYNDPFRGLGAVGYDLYDEMCRSRGVLNDYVWKRALFDLEDVTATSTGESSGEDAEGQFFTGAKCFPKGFPVIIYLNGSFYGIFAWQLKKHRDNYHMKKNKAKQIHLDGVITNEDLFNANGDSSQIVWTTNSPEGIEIRNPKTLYLMDGTKYDADNNGGELIDATSPNYNPGKADHVITAEVKAHILGLSRVKGIISTARTAYESSPKTDADLATFKSVFETYFDPDNLIDYLILSDVVNNYDGWAKNWQWLTYNGTKWYVMPYDLDGIFGNWWQLNDTIVPPLTAHTASGFWTSDLINYYGAALNARYAELRNAGIIDVTHIQRLCVSWLDRIGNKGMFDKEWEKWPGFIKNDSPMRLAKWIEESISNNDIIYQFNQ